MSVYTNITGVQQRNSHSPLYLISLSQQNRSQRRHLAVGAVLCLRLRLLLSPCRVCSRRSRLKLPKARRIQLREMGQDTARSSPLLLQYDPVWMAAVTYVTNAWVEKYVTKLLAYRIRVSEVSGRKCAFFCCCCTLLLLLWSLVMIHPVIVVMIHAAAFF